MPRVEKARHWAGVVYPESLPPDWQDRLQQTGLPIAISPLHDQDVNADGTPKKPHYHVIMCYDGPTTFNVVKAIFDDLGQPGPQKIGSVKGYYRYFGHLDNPEKAQYGMDGVQTINGFSILDFAELTKSQTLAIKRDLQNLILEMGFTDYDDLMDYVLFNGKDEEYDVACSNTTFFVAYLKGKWRKQGGQG